MSVPRLLLLIVVITAMITGALYAFRPALSEEDRVREVVHAVVAGAEAGDIGDIMAPLGQQFSVVTDGESIDRDTVRSLLTSQFVRRGPLLIVVGEIDVTITGAKARASLDAILAEGSDGWADFFPVAAEGWHFELDFEREGEAWKVRHAVRTDAAPLQIAPE